VKIVIAGAGSVGYHLAALLAKENQDITVIDRDEEVLERVGNKLDLLTLHGSATSVEILS